MKSFAILCLALISYAVCASESDYQKIRELGKVTWAEKIAFSNSCKSIANLNKKTELEKYFSKVSDDHIEFMTNIVKYEKSEIELILIESKKVKITPKPSLKICEEHHEAWVNNEISIERIEELEKALDRHKIH